jgi:hypothetical protein
VNSTARGVADLPLGPADVQECLSAASRGSTPTWAVKLIGGQTNIAKADLDTDARDLRQLVNNVPAYALQPDIIQIQVFT